MRRLRATAVAARDGHGQVFAVELAGGRLRVPVPILSDDGMLVGEVVPDGPGSGITHFLTPPGSAGPLRARSASAATWPRAMALGRLRHRGSDSPPQDLREVDPAEVGRFSSAAGGRVTVPGSCRWKDQPLLRPAPGSAVAVSSVCLDGSLARGWRAPKAGRFAP
jgi:hypothetical protein